MHWPGAHAHHNLLRVCGAPVYPLFDGDETACAPGRIGLSDALRCAVGGRRVCGGAGVGILRDEPAELPPSHEERARAASAGVHAAKGIAQDDAAGRRQHLRDNLRFYGAPVAMIFHLPANAAPGTFLEMGFFIQNVMLGLVARGLASCPQASVAGYSDAIRAFLGFGSDRLIVCGMSAGYAETAPVNAFAPERAPLEDYTQWLDGSSSQGV